MVELVELWMAAMLPSSQNQCLQVTANITFLTGIAGFLCSVATAYWQAKDLAIDTLQQIIDTLIWRLS